MVYIAPYFLELLPVDYENSSFETKSALKEI